MSSKDTKKRPWLLKRLVYKFLTWLDELLFSGKATQDFTSVSEPFWITVIISFWLGMVMVVSTMFVDKGTGEQILSVGAGIGLLSVLAVTVWYLIGTLKYFPSAMVRIVRSAYTLILCVLGFVIGFYSAVIFSFVLLFLLVLSILYYAVFGGKSKRIVLDSGKELTHEKGLCGEDYYSDSEGRSWSRSGDTFTRQ